MTSSLGRYPWRFALRRATITLTCAGLVLAMAAPAALAYTFGEPSVRATGPEVRVFDWSADKCNDNDIPDQPSRAYRDASGRVVLINSHFTVRRKVGDTLATVGQLPCATAPSSFSGNNADPAKYDDKEWIASPYTIDGTQVHALVHSEYQGYNYSPGYCIRSGESFAEKQRCWYNSLTLASSSNGGASFSHAPPPGHYVAGAPYRYRAGDGPIGFFQPSNIVRGEDNYYYVLVHVEDYGVQPYGSCLWRTTDLANPRSWRAWSSVTKDFTVEFRDPYLHTYDPLEGVCSPVSRNHIGTISESLTWSTYLEKWVLVGSADNADGVSGSGFYYYTSNDLVNWSQARLLMTGELPWTHRCQDGAEQVRDPSLLDNDSETRNFETIGRRPFLFFTRFNVQFNSPTSCYTSLDRDLIRIPLEFTKDPEPDPGPGGGGTGGGGSPGGGTPGGGTPPAGGGAPPAGGGSQGGTPGSPAQPAPAATVNVSTPPLGRFRLVGKPRSRANGTLLLRVHAPSAGRLTLRAVGRRAAVRPAKATAAKPGVVSLTVRLSSAGVKLLRRKPQARVKTLLVFTPVGGAPQKATQVLKLRRPGRS